MSGPMLLPEGMGIEEEFRYTLNGKPPTEDDDKRVVSYMHGLTRSQVVFNGFNSGQGSHIYYDLRGPEYATPECADPSQLREYVSAGYGQYLEALGRLCLFKSRREREPIVGRTWRRNRDDSANTIGSHGNFDIPAELAEAFLDTDRMRHAYLGHAAARSFIAGAGYVSDVLHYSQKRSLYHKEIHGRGFMRTVFKVRDDAKPSFRLEARDNDLLFSDWALEVGAAGTDSLLALMRTPLIDRLNVKALSPFFSPGPRNPMNLLRLQDDGTIRPTDALKYGVEYEATIAKLMLEEFSNYGELPDLYRFLMQEQLRYCTDFERVITGQDDVRLLFGRSDWATKYTVIQRQIERDRNLGKKRSLTDRESRMRDSFYHYVQVRADATADEENRVTYAYGTGYDLWQKGKFALGTKPEDSLPARTAPPRNTRAAERCLLMETHELKVVNWHAVRTSLDRRYLLPKVRGGNL